MTTKRTPQKTAAATVEREKDNPRTEREESARVSTKVSVKNSRIASAKTLWLVSAATLTLAVAAVLVLSRPKTEPTGPVGPTTLVRRAGELPAAHDDETRFAPGSPGAVAERFLRLWFRLHYDQARELAVGDVRHRCEHNLAQWAEAPSVIREELRETQVYAEAAAFDLERAVVTDLPPAPVGSATDAGPPRARRSVVGELHAHGPLPDGRRIDSRRGQSLVVVLIDGAWRVAEWRSDRTDGGMQIIAGETR